MKIGSLDEATRKRVTEKETSDSFCPQKVNNAKLIEAICRIAIPGSPANERRLSEVIRMVETLDQSEKN